MLSCWQITRCTGCDSTCVGKELISSTLTGLRADDLAGLGARGVASGEDITEGPGTGTEKGERNVLALGVEGVSC